MVLLGYRYDHLGPFVNLLGPNLHPTYETVKERLSSHQQQHSSCRKDSSCRKPWCSEKLRVFLSSLEIYRSTGGGRGPHQTQPSSWCLDVFGPELPRSPHERAHWATSLDLAKSKLRNEGCRFPESALLHAIVLVYEEKFDLWLCNKKRRIAHGQLEIRRNGIWVDSSQFKQVRHRWFPEVKHSSRETKAGRTHDSDTEEADSDTEEADSDTEEAQVSQDNEGIHELGSEAEISLAVCPESDFSTDFGQVEMHGQPVPTGPTSPSLSRVSFSPRTELTLLREGSLHTDHGDSQDPSPCLLTHFPDASCALDNEHLCDNETEAEFLDFLTHTLHLEVHETGKVNGPSTPPEVSVTPSYIESLTSTPGGRDHSEGNAHFGGFPCQNTLEQDAANLDNDANPPFGCWATGTTIPSTECRSPHDMQSLGTGRSGNSLDWNMQSTQDTHCQRPDARIASCMDQARNLHKTNSRKRLKRKLGKSEHEDSDFLEQRAVFGPETISLKDVIKEVPKIFQSSSGGKSLDELRGKNGKQLRADWVKAQVQTLVREYPGLNVLVYTTGSFVEGPFGSVVAEKKRYLPNGSEKCLRMAMARCDDPEAAYEHVAPLVGCVTYHLAVFKSGSFQNFADEGEVNCCFKGNTRRAREIHTFVEFF